jgi:hypothetical protein
MLRRIGLFMLIIPMFLCVPWAYASNYIARPGYHWVVTPGGRAPNGYAVNVQTGKDAQGNQTVEWECVTVYTVCYEMSANGRTLYLNDFNPMGYGSPEDNEIVSYRAVETIDS